MLWEDYGFLLSKNKFGENSAISEFYTKHGFYEILFSVTGKCMVNIVLSE